MSTLINRFQYGGYANNLSSNDLNKIILKNSANLESIRKRAGWIVGLQMATMAELQIHHRENMRVLGEINNSLKEINDNITSGFNSLEDAIFKLESNLLLELSDIKWVLSGMDKKLEGILNFLEFPRATEADELIRQGTITYSKNYFEDAELCFSRAEKLNPTCYNLKISQGFLYLHKENIEDAIKNFKKAVDFSDSVYHKKDIPLENIIKSKIYALECLARAYYAAENYNEAYKEMEESTSLRKSIKYLDKNSFYLKYLYYFLSGNKEIAFNQILYLAKNDFDLYKKSVLDPDLIEIRNQLITEYEKSLNEKVNEVNQKVVKFKINYESIENDLTDKVKQNIKTEIDSIENVLKSGHYDELNNSIDKINIIQNLMDDYKEKIIKYKVLTKEINELNKEIDEYQVKKKNLPTHNMYEIFSGVEREKLSYLNSIINYLDSKLKMKKTEIENLKLYIK